MTSKDPKEIAKAFLLVQQERNFDALDDLLAEDFVGHFPFAPTNIPTLFQGRDHFRGVLRKMVSVFSRIRLYDIDMRATDDPELFVATGRSEMDIAAGGKYENQYVFFFRVRDGKIVEYWEYFNPLAIAKAFGKG